MGEYAEYEIERLIWGPSYRYGRTRKRKIMTNKSNTRYVDLEGISKFPMVYQPDEYNGAVFWKVNLYMDENNFRKFNSLGLANISRHDRAEGDPDDRKLWTGEEYVTFRRPQFKLMGKKVVYFAPPKIYDRNRKLVVSYTDADGNPINSYEDANIEPQRKGDVVLIGNGSKVAVNLAVYNTAKGMASRLEGLRILDLVEYNPEGKEDDGSYDFGSVKVQGTGVDSGSGAANSQLAKDLDDEIPF